MLTLERDQFTGLLGSLETIRHMWRFETVKKVPLLISLPNSHKFKVAMAFKTVEFKEGSVIVEQVKLGHPTFKAKIFKH